MTDQTNNAPGFQNNACFRPQVPEGETTVRSRLLEVATWIWRMAAIGIACWFVVAAGILYVEYGRPDEVFGLLALYFVGALVLGGIVWTAHYVITGERRSYLATLKAASFGNLALYFWFVPAVLVVGAFGTAIWNDGANDYLRLQHLSEGVGGAFFVLILGAPAWFFAPKAYSHTAHMIGTVVAGALVLAVNFFAI